MTFINNAILYNQIEHLGIQLSDKSGICYSCYPRAVLIDAQGNASAKNQTQSAYFACPISFRRHTQVRWQWILAIILATIVFFSLVFIIYYYFLNNTSDNLWTNHVFLHLLVFLTCGLFIFHLFHMITLLLPNGSDIFKTNLSSGKIYMNDPNFTSRGQLICAIDIPKEWLWFSLIINLLALVCAIILASAVFYPRD